MATKMANNMFNLKIDPNLVVFVKRPILNNRARAVIFLIFAVDNMFGSKKFCVG